MSLHRTIPNDLPAIYQYMGVKLMKNLDVQRLLSEVHQVEHHCKWIERSSMKSWHAIPLRSYQGGITAQHVQHAGVHHYSNASLFKDTELMKYCPYINELINSLGAPLYKVRLMKMDAKKTLAPHTDTFYFHNTCRLHIVVKSKPEVTMTVAKQKWHLEEGTMYFTNVLQLHSVQNDSNEDRIHVVFDVEWCDKLNEWLQEALKNVTENIK